MVWTAARTSRIGAHFWQHGIPDLLPYPEYAFLWKTCIALSYQTEWALMHTWTLQCVGFSALLYQFAMVVHLTLKRLERYRVPGLTIEWSWHGSSHVRQKNCVKKLYWTFTFQWQLILTNMQSYRHCPLFTKDKKENCQKIRNLGSSLWQQVACFIVWGTGMTCKLTYMSASMLASKFSLQVSFRSF